MEESILNTIKKLLGGSTSSSDTYFDTDIITHINTTFSILHQLGVGPDNFKITGSNETWSDYLGDSTNLEDVKTYIYLKVRMVFDPPASNVADVFNKNISELEWRLNTEVDPG